MAQRRLLQWVAVAMVVESALSFRPEAGIMASRKGVITFEEKTTKVGTTPWLGIPT